MTTKMSGGGGRMLSVRQDRSYRLIFLRFLCQILGFFICDLMVLAGSEMRKEMQWWLDQSHGRIDIS